MSMRRCTARWLPLRLAVWQKKKRRWDSGMSNAGGGVLVMVADATAAPRCRAGTEGGREKKEDLIAVCAHCGVEQSFDPRTLVLEVFLQLRLL